MHVWGSLYLYHRVRYVHHPAVLISTTRCLSALGDKTAMESEDMRDLNGPQSSTGSAPAAVAEDGPAPGLTSEGGLEPVPKDGPPLRVPKRRTKTGCLTCRKRRIKCGEEKPKCKNCIKAKRECERYTPRVVFRHPLGPFGPFQPGQTMNTLSFPHQRQPGSHQRLLAPRIPYLAPAHPAGFGAPPDAPPMHGNRVEQPQPFYYPAVYGTAPSQPLLSQGPPYITGIEGHGNGGTQVSSTGQTVYQGPFGTDQLHDQGLPSIPEAPGTFDPFQLNDSPKVQTHHQEHIASILHGRKATYTSPVLQSSSSRMLYSETESEDYYDVESGEETEEMTQDEVNNQLNLIMASVNQDPLMVRSYTTFLNEPNILADYRPSMGSSPLNNPKTARIWLHFIHATGPSWSLWERHPTNSSLLFDSPVPPSHQGMWNYTMPLKSVEHPALLQAILAISSLHIAKLQQTSMLVSLKHYKYALKRLRKAVSLPLPRKQVETLAATLILGFYEVTAAEHTKWNAHVAGGAQLIKEIDFAGITRDLRAYRRNVRAQRYQMALADPWLGFGDFSESGPYEDDPFGEKESDLDEELIGTLIGKAVDYDQFGQVENGDQHLGREKHFTRKDIENFRIQCDLYWWYCKHDLIQSIISGNPLYLSYDRWDQCPPRAGLGKLDALYGSFDHLLLLLARLADFSVRDRKRKLKSLEGSGGEWRPFPGFFKFMARFGGKPPDQGPPGGTSHHKPQGPAGGPPSSSASISSSNTAGGYSEHMPSATRSAAPSGPNSGPQQFPSNSNAGSHPMYGMVPSNGPSDPPAAFVDSAYTHGPSHGESTEDDVEVSLSEAEAEWESIRAAFDLYSGRLGPGFAPLPIGSAPPIGSPFGQALQYRSHQMAVLWAYYYAGRILLHRFHPCMPSAATVAAGVAASTTAQYAQTVGKIAAGIQYPQRYNLEAGSLNPTLGNALTEVTVPVFFAGVQFTDPAQRGWTIAKLRNIARLTGWETAAAVASGCERAWYFAGKAGRGPPYTLYEVNKVVDEEGKHLRRDADKQVSIDPDTDQRFVRVDKPIRIHWAMGLLEMEDDLVNLRLDD